MDKAYDKYKSYSNIEKPRISKKEVLMGKIELLIQSKRYDDALKNLNTYENNYGMDEKSDLYKGQMLQKNGKNEEALKYLEKSLQNEDTLIGLNAKGDALYDLRRYDEALKVYKNCLQYESKVEDDLELVTNFNYKAAFCCVNMGDDANAIKYLNKTINMLNEHGRLAKDIEAIYQKCSFEKERILKKGEVKDEEFKKTKFFSTKTSLIILAVILVLYFILKYMGYSLDVPGLIFRIIHIVIDFLVPVVVSDIVIDFLVQSPIVIVIICVRVESILYDYSTGLHCFFIFRIAKELDLDSIHSYRIFFPNSAFV